ncbi:MAG: M20/M25/M40 family metallo-hydrolase [Actinomycetia bacterium]|nr:M20/M25/M40 family metallo-hydrolase [Actinomycetes bacterium]
MTDVVGLLQQLVRFDTSNWGHGRSSGETPCALWIEGLLREVGYEPQLLWREDSPDRGNVVVRVEGTEPGLGGLVVHGHLDVVPAEPEEWSVDPFGGVVRDGFVYGRGTVDMKDMVACMLATLLTWAEHSVRPRRDLVFAFVADEEDAGEYGAGWLVQAHPGLFAGCEAAIGEEGGQVYPARSATGDEVRLYPVAVAERGTLHCRLTARGVGGHGSRPTGKDAVAQLVAVLARVQQHRWPRQVPDAVRAQVAAMAQALGHQVDVDDEDSYAAFCEALGPQTAGPLPWTVRPSATVTVLQAGTKVNVVPSVATAEVDVRCPPGSFETTRQALLELVGPDLEVELLNPGPPCESPVDSPWFEAIRTVITATDPEAAVVPMCLGGGTDAKAFASLGLLTYGFTPLGPDPEGRRPDGVHGVDERNTVAGLRVGERMLRRFLEQV